MDDNIAQIPPGMLLRVMQDKQAIINYYGRLYAMAADVNDSSLIKNILQDEMTHLVLFENLYIQLFGPLPESDECEAPQINSFLDGVKFAIMSEQAKYNAYGNIFFTDGNESVRNTFLRALFDENSHSIKFNYIFAKSIGNERF